MENKDGGFFVKLPLDKTLRVMKEVGNAFPLLWMLCGRVTRSYAATAIGIRVGAVLGSMPYTDRDVAEALTRSGFPCDRFQVCKWRRKLADKGLIAWVRTPAGVRVFVIGYDKFAEQEAEPLPEWAAGPVCEAFRNSQVVKTDTLSESTHHVVKTDTSCCQNRHIQYKKRSRNKEETKGHGQPDFLPLADEEEELCFDSPYLKVTHDQDEALQREFESLRLDFPAMQQEYDKAVAWIESQPSPEPASNPVAFMRKWLSGSRRFTQPPVETHPDHRGKPGWDTELNIPLAERPF